MEKGRYFSHKLTKVMRFFWNFMSKVQPCLTSSTFFRFFFPLAAKRKPCSTEDLVMQMAPCNVYYEMTGGENSRKHTGNQNKGS